MTAVFADGETNGFAVFGKRRGVNDEIDGGLFLVAAPEGDLVVNEIDTSAAFGDLVGPNDLLQMDANARAGVGHRQVNDSGVFF